MKTKFNGILTLLLALVVQLSFAQTETISGNVSDETGPLPGVSIVIKGTTVGTETDFDGNYSIEANAGDILQFSFVGMATQEVTVGNSNTVNVTLVADNVLDEVVVTALGIKREKKALGYATTQIKGEAVNTAKETNFMNSLSGKVAGLSIKKSNNLGGSTNVILRGYTSITGNNQPLFIVDGTPISNSNTNSGGQATGRGGYDYGNAAMDINPEDIESINILKGAAASNLYGSRAANGVIIITTKKGKRGQGLGVTVNSGISFANYDADTFVKYQDEYGAGYSNYYYGSTGGFFDQDINGDSVDDLTTVFSEDASFGERFDPNLMVYQWDAFYPESDNYLMATPWVAGKNKANSVFETGVTLTNSVTLSSGSDTGSFRLSYSNLNQTGILPNSSLKRNTFDFNGEQDLSDKFKVGVKVTYTKTDGKGRNGTGYHANNGMQSFRQWSQMNVDYKDQKTAYFRTRRNITWNYGGDPLTAGGREPIYFDNPYWVLYENYETDTRSRLFGNVNLTYQATDWLTIIARTSIDTYNELQEERTAVSSTNLPQYSRYNRSFEEINYDLLFNLNFDLTEKLSLDGLVGATARTQNINSIYAATSGGLVVPRLYSLSNSVNLLPPPGEYEGGRKDYGFYGNASFSYNNLVYLDLSGRYDISSTLPDDNNGFFYPAISTSVIISQLIEADWLSFAKVRGNWAQVGNSTNPYRVYDSYYSPTNFSVPLFSVNSTKNNKELRNELTTGWEFGLEASFMKRRFGFDLAYYNTDTEDQIFNVAIDPATGYSRKIVNSGVINNKGVELSAYVTPVRNENFEWTLSGVYAKNESEVMSLYEGVDNLQMGSMQGGVSLNATVGQPYGTIWGSNFTFENGQRVIDATSGRYVKDATPQIIGDINPDYKAGITNTLKYKNLTFSFLIDIQKGGSVFSLDTWYGYGTGIYDITAGLNELGNPKRDAIADGGGILLQGVNPGGATNTTRTRMDYYANALGWVRAPNALHVYDASYVKLREITLSYKMSSKFIEKTPFNDITVSAVGRNLWIIHKNMPYSDPEAGLSSGNLQGYQSGAAPAQKEYGFNVKFNF